MPRRSRKQPGMLDPTARLNAKAGADNPLTIRDRDVVKEFMVSMLFLRSYTANNPYVIHVRRIHTSAGQNRKREMLPRRSQCQPGPDDRLVDILSIVALAHKAAIGIDDSRRFQISGDPFIASENLAS